MATFSYILFICCDSSEEWSDFIHIQYSNQVPCVTDTYELVLDSMPNFSNYRNIFFNFMFCCNISEKKGLMILFIFGTVINHKKDLMHVKYNFALCQNVEVKSIIS